MGGLIQHYFRNVLQKTEAHGLHAHAPCFKIADSPKKERKKEMPWRQVSTEREIICI